MLVLKAYTTTCGLLVLRIEPGASHTLVKCSDPKLLLPAYMFLLSLSFIYPNSLKPEQTFTLTFPLLIIILIYVCVCVC